MSTRKRRWHSHLPTLLRDRVLLAMTGWTVLAFLHFLFFAGSTHRQVQFFWVCQPPLDAMLALFSWRVHRLATGPTRRFWLVMTVAGTLFTIGDTIQAILSLTRPESTSSTGGTVQSAFFGVGLLLVVIAMLVHPHPTRSGRERLAFWLDAATLLVGGAVVAWCFADQGPTADLMGTLVTGGVLLTGTFAAVKMILSGNAPMNRLAALPMIASAAAMSLGVLLAPLADTALGPLVLAVRFLPSLLIAVGPRIQEVLAHHAAEPFGERRRKPYSLLPYVSMAGSFAVLVVILPDGVTPRLWGAVGGLGLICALVAARQLVAFHDNTALIRRLREHEARLRHQALFDGLTGLANRTHFHEQVTEALAGPDAVALLIIDLDGFKAVNDTMGHAAGDQLLVAVADKLRAATREADLAARLGGDEFAVLLRDCAPGVAEHTSHRILRALRIPVEIGGGQVRVGASIGLATAGPDADAESLVRDADLAMYVAKSEGKGRLKRATPV